MIRTFTEPKDFLCIYHKNCADGFTGAWVVKEWAKMHNHVIEYAGGEYGKDPVPINRRHVILVDFSYPEDVLIRMSEYAASITILDHHKTAEENLKNIEAKAYCPIDVIFDMDRSGCEIAWDFFFPYENKPRVLEAVADRDLWKFNKPYTKEISAFVFSLEYTFENWDKLMSYDINDVISSGSGILMKHSKDVNELFNSIVYWVNIVTGLDDEFYRIPVANVPYMYASEMGNKLCLEYPDASFAATYYFDGKQYKFSLRSTDNQLDCSKIAKAFGGGGHRNASGFSVDKLPWS